MTVRIPLATSLLGLAATTLTACGGATTASAPASSAAAATTPASSANTFGPTGYDGIELGMTLAQAEAAGATVVPDQGPAACLGLHLPHSTAPVHASQVLVSTARGTVVLIIAPPGATTPEGIHDGSTQAQTLAAWPDAKLGPIDWTVSVPGNPKATYEFGFIGDKILALNLEQDQDCVG